MAGLWRITPGQQLAARCWEEETVLYNNLSGDTHLLDADSMFLLEQLRMGPASVDVLVQGLGSDMHPDDVTALPATLETMLDQLKALYLVESC